MLVVTHHLVGYGLQSASSVFKPLLSETVTTEEALVHRSSCGNKVMTYMQILRFRGKSGRIYLQSFLKCTLQLKDVDTKVSFAVEHFRHLLIVDIC